MRIIRWFRGFRRCPYCGARKHKSQMLRSLFAYFCNQHCESWYEAGAH